MNKIFIFVLGAAVGSLVTWKIVEERYKRLADEEIESVKEYYKSKEEAKEHIVEVQAFEEKIEEPYVKVYEEKVEELGYSNEDEGVFVTDYCGIDYIAPYVIAPEEFGDLEGYDTKSWTYYSDFVLTDEIGEIVVDPESLIGDALEHFGEFEDDSVYVRNENLECEYEILKHEKSFNELNKEDS